VIYKQERGKDQDRYEKGERGKGDLKFSDRVPVQARKKRGGRE